MPLLQVRGVSIRFGGIVALDRLSFDVETGCIAGLIGPNGAGKTTLFNCLSRLYEPDEGDIVFDGRSLRGMAPHSIAALGIGRTFQNLALFKSLSVFENVMLGGHSRARGGFFAHALRLPLTGRGERAAAARAAELVEFLDLARVQREPVASLPFGTQKRVELARALASDPRLLLLDEPASGLNHEEVAALVALIRRIRALRVTVLLVEHHMSLVMSVSDKVVALDFGRKIADDTPERVRSDPGVQRAYLGTAAEEAT